MLAFCLQILHLPELDANLLQCHFWNGCEVIVLPVLPSLDSEFPPRSAHLPICYAPAWKA